MNAIELVERDENEPNEFMENNGLEFYELVETAPNHLDALIERAENLQEQLSEENKAIFFELS